MSVLLDISSFEAVFQVNYPALCATSYRIVEDKAIAEEIVKDIFYKLWEKKDALTIDISLKAYLFQNAIRQSIAYKKKYASALASKYAGSFQGSSENNALKISGTEFPVDAAIRALPDTCKTVFVLNRYEHLDFDEIAAGLGITKREVEIEMHYALKHLRDYLL